MAAASRWTTLFLLSAVLLAGARAEEEEQQQKQPSAVELFEDIYETCLQHYSISCVKPKALAWISKVVDSDLIRITEDMDVVKDATAAQDEDEDEEEQRSFGNDVYDKFDQFLLSHRVVMRMPAALRSAAAADARSSSDEELSIPLAATGRSKFVKKVMIPFLLGLKFKTAVLVPLTLAMIALKSWKALTLALLSLVLTGAMLLFKFTKPKVINYEVIHYPQPHVEHHIEHPPVPTGWEHPTGYGRKFTAQELAYNSYRQ